MRLNKTSLAASELSGLGGIPNQPNIICNYADPKGFLLRIWIIWVSNLWGHVRET